MNPLFRSANPTGAIYPHLPHGPVDPLLVFLFDQFHSVTVKMYVLLQALPLKILQARTPPLHRTDRQGSDSHT
ncbi:unnamed protein product [Protopolystoma xenopodis]|uniref:Uncharacterized protein n=1 Tax=Protopolystoma xenopodis TaxID=117903 RepID=A0A448WJ20_9PLAT|nr:unnamed protein product [Protopolystoma xenopodis]